MSAIQMTAWMMKPTSALGCLPATGTFAEASCATRSWVWKFVGSVALKTRSSLSVQVMLSGAIATSFSWRSWSAL